MALFERADSSKRVTWWSLVGLILVPVLIAGGFVWATKGADTRFGQTTAAIVNNDEGTTIDGKTVPMGRQLSAALVDTETENYSWVQSTTEDAADGLENGTYVAVVTIPEGFSEAVLSTAKDDPIDVEQATIQVQTSDVSPVNNAVISRALVEAARTQFNTDMAQQFLDGVFVGFNDMADQFRTMSDAANELDDGAGQLAEGTSELAGGTQDLAGGLNQLDANGGQLASGATDLANGAGDLGAGARQLSDGAGQLADGLGQMKNQTQNLPGQVQQLADGADDLADGTKQYTDGVSQLAGGASDLSDGVDEYTQNIDSVVTGVREFADKLSGIDLSELDKLKGSDAIAQMDQNSQDIQTFLDGVETLNTGLSDYQDGLAAQAKKLAGQVGQVTTLNQAVKLGLMDSKQASAVRGQICSALPEGADDPACAVVESAYVSGLLTGVSSGLEQAASALDTQDPNTGKSLISGSASLSQAAQDISGQVADITAFLEQFKGMNLSDLGVSVDKLEKDLEAFKAGTDQLLDGSEQLRNGASDLADGAGQLSDKGGDLVDGADQLADGVNQLAGGMGPLADGIGRSADGAKGLASGAAQLADGAGQLEDGGREFSRGLRQYTFGVTQAADGAGQLVDGSAQLADGADQLADGTGQFAQGLEDGKDEIPSYTAPERDKLATAVSAAIDDSATRFVNGPVAQAVALLLILALWVGSLVTYMVVRAVSATALTSRRNSWAIMLKGLVPGLAVAGVQALLVTGLAQSLMLLPTSRAIHLFAFALFASVVFTVLNFALAGLFGAVGRIVSLAMIVLAVAARITASVAPSVDTIAGFLPPTHGIDGVLAIATGTPGAASAWGVLFLWLILGVGGSIVAVARARSVSSVAGLVRA